MRQDYVLVTGASGFIGRRIVERLRKENYRIRALVRRVPTPVFDSSIEVVTGDLAKPETYAGSLSGATAIVHAALTEDKSADVQLTETLSNLCSQAGIAKFIHLSSIAIYGNPQEGTITEETRPVPTSDPYSRTKLAIEEMLKAKSGIPEISILRLGCVYGSGGGWWTQGLLQLMRHGRLILVDRGLGTANLIHVDDVATLIPILLARSNPSCSVYNITDGMPVTWHRYFSELEAVLGRKATVSMGASEAKEYARKWLQPSVPRRAIRKLKGRNFVYPLDENSIGGFTSHAVYSNRKAETVLGFKPAYSLPDGIRYPLE